ncbi:MAG: HEAT repeat domain-containing protein [Thermodesulfovibrio sp.]|nr:HEAT repeat domain-containing protein [Thermodesulfovibrio sp.]
MPIRKREEEKIIEIKEERRKKERNFENLKEQLLSSSPNERRWAARDLAQYKEASQILLERIKNEEDVSVIENILSSLSSIRDEVAVKGLIELLRSENAYLRNAVIETLKSMPEEVESYIEELIKSPESDLRIFAINIMESLRHPKVLKWLKEIIENDENVNVCSTALDLVAEVGTEDFLPSIEKIKEKFSDEPYVQFVADLAIRRINEGKNSP